MSRYWITARSIGCLSHARCVGSNRSWDFPTGTDMTFENLGLHASLLRAVAAEGYASPTPIQAQSIPHLAEGRDLLGVAQNQQELDRVLNVARNIANVKRVVNHVLMKDDPRRFRDPPPA